MIRIISPAAFGVIVATLPLGSVDKPQEGLQEAQDGRFAPCTLHVFGSGLIGRLAGRVGLPGATFCPLCHEYLGGTRAPAGWPRCKSSGELRLERQYRD